MKFNERLALIMNDLQLSQAELAHKVNLSPATISNMLRGESSPNFNNVQKIIDNLSIEHSLFLIFDKRKSNEINAYLNEDSVPYLPAPNTKNEIEELKKRVEELEKWKDRVTGK